MSNKNYNMIKNKKNNDLHNLHIEDSGGAFAHFALL